VREWDMKCIIAPYFCQTFAKISIYVQKKGFGMIWMKKQLQHKIKGCPLKSVQIVSKSKFWNGIFGHLDI
jgi:hypothetical protein